MNWFNQETIERIKKLQTLKENWINPYPSKFDKQFSTIQISNLENWINLKTAWRIVLKREMWKINFITILDQFWNIQLAFKEDVLWKENLKFFLKNVDVWDIIWVEWETFTTKTGEKTILVKSWTMLTKSLLPLPEKFHWIQDIETKLRKRYLDICLNNETKDMFIRKSKYYKYMREFLDSKWFMEVETPVLETTTWWADANPFVTHHKAFDIDVFLRISTWELWQKRLMVWWYEKIYEIWKIFRNEWVSPEHAQDYSQMEIYWAYANYEDMMNLMKEMYLYVIDKVYWTRKFKIRWFDVDFDQEWKHYDYTQTIKEFTWIDIFSATDAQITEKLQLLNIKYEWENRLRLIDTLWKFCRKKIPWPWFLVNEPKDMSPLSKSKPENTILTERFHILIAWSEVWNWYSELNDPLDQKERFEIQQKLRDEWDDEAQMADFDFVEALMHWMPPTAWFWISERLFAFLEDKPIRETQIFPLMKPIEQEKEKNSWQYEWKKIEIKNTVKDSKLTNSQILQLNEKEYKFIAILNKKFEIWKLFNALWHATAWLVSISNELNQFWFLEYKDKDNWIHPAISHYWFIVLKADNSNQIKNVREICLQKNILFNDFCESMTIWTSKQQYEKTQNLSSQELEYMGIVMFSDSNSFGEFTKKFSLFK